MSRRYQTILTICLMILMALSCLRIDNTSDIFSSSTFSFDLSRTSVIVGTEACQVDGEFSRIEQQDYLSADHSTCLSASLFRRSQNNIRNHERYEVSTAILDVVSKVVLFSFIMFLFATGGAGLSMPFRCLLYYIQDIDGKKKMA